MAGSASRAAGRVVGRAWVGVFPALLALAALRLVLVPAAAAAIPLTDPAPTILAVWPLPEADDVPPDAAGDGSLAIVFSEPVSLAAGALALVCERSQVHTLSAAGGPASWNFVSDRGFQPGEGCVATARAEGVSDLDADDPPDSLETDYAWSFQVAGRPVIINEVDAISDGGGGDFIELYDGGRGGTSLDGLTVVLYRGDEASVYLAVGLDGYRTDAAGTFVLGAGGVAGVDLRLADGPLRDGPDAVALYDAPEGDFPRNAPLTTDDLLDAAVYGPADERLLALLVPGQAALDEAARGAAAMDSSQRCPNGGGQPRESTSFIQNNPTPGLANNCVVDVPPRVVETSPAAGAGGVPLDAAVEVAFSEAVHLAPEAVAIACTAGGVKAYQTSGGPVHYRFQPVEPFTAGESCAVTVFAAGVRDVDGEDPPDTMGSDVAWSFAVVEPAVGAVLINEVDSDSPGVDQAEFIELYDGGVGDMPLNGLVLVLFNGVDDRSYLVVDLAGEATDANGYLVIGNAAVGGAGIVLPDGIVQNGPDAVALFAGDEADFPAGTPVTETVPLDAVVYSRPTQVDPGLQPLLNPGQPPVDENGRGEADAHSLQRCPNGRGGLRNTAGFKQNSPTPGAANDCITDTAPVITATTPEQGATGVPPGSLITVQFSEPVTLAGKWATLKCTQSGNHAYRTSGGPTLYALEPTEPMSYGESCTLTVNPGRVADNDADDPPDTMAQAAAWSFTTAAPPADFILINEIDADTAGQDTAEFIELYDGGAGHTSLNGLALVLFNGSSDRSYRAIDLDGVKTDASGYLVIGNAATNPAVPLPDGILQNGPDAVALYAGDASMFPTDSPAGIQGLIDATVYGDPADVSPALRALLREGELPVAEGGRGAADAHSLQRCPDGTGGQRRTASFKPNAPTPGRANVCISDTPPAIIDTSPANGATGLSIHSTLSVTFSEPVQLDRSGIELSCASGGLRSLGLGGGPVQFTLTPSQPLLYHDSCRVTVKAPAAADDDADDPPDQMTADFSWSFSTSSPPPDFIVINEIDADTPGSDTAEFIELYDGGRGATDLSGLVVVLYNGFDDRSYKAIDLLGQRTDAAGYLLIGNAGVPGVAVELGGGVLQNGADAVALYAGDGSRFPNGTTLHTHGLLDAVVYGTGDPADQGLLALLHAGEQQVDEAGRGSADSHSSGRCPSGEGGQRRTATFRQDTPTPGAPNQCTPDAPPRVIEVSPADGTSGVAGDSVIEVTFSEEVNVQADWLRVICDKSGGHDFSSVQAAGHFTVVLDRPLTPDERCTLSIRAASVADSDSDDPPDHPLDDFSWSFRTAVAPPDFIVINELDPDTPGSDTMEFVELYDGGAGHVDLSGLVLVFWNGNDDRAYRAFDLDGMSTSAEGYFMVGNAAVAGADVVMANGTLQNGPDAVALYRGSGADFAVGRELTTVDLLDAVVYGSADKPDKGLLGLMLAGQSQIDEGQGGAADSHSLQRCPNGEGGQRRSAAYRGDAPSPGTANRCIEDDPPSVRQVYPEDGSTQVPPDAELRVEFDEDVAASGDWYRIDCEAGGRQAGSSSGGPRHYTISPAQPFVPGDRCRITLVAAAIHDVDANDPPDVMAADFTWRFTVAGTVTAVVINELDADTPGRDEAEFIELYDGGRGRSSLAGLVVVLWNGKSDTAYRAIDLSGFETDENGYFILGHAAIEPDLELGPNTVQNGPDAVAVYAGPASDFPIGAPLSQDGLIDAVVYGPAGAPDEGLLALLVAGQDQIAEGSAAESHSLQRCPDGAGGPRRTDSFRPASPTPGATNHCPAADDPPRVLAVSPGDGAAGVDRATALLIEFSEAVAVAPGWYEITCADSGAHPAAVTGGPRSYTLTPVTAFEPGERCTVRVDATAVRDSDSDDPPDAMAGDFRSSFTTAPAPPPTAGFASNSPIWIGETAVFTNTSAGPEPLSYEWDFGDGHGVSSSALPTYIYQKVGTYTVTLTVAGPTGTASYSAEIEVRPRWVFMAVGLK